MRSNMECYRCGGKLSSGNYCLGCGADLTLYRRILMASNSYYNIGLEKARVRDLTGAAAALRMSLQLNKKNIQARNLLGLICFERGELASALVCWVISQDYDGRPSNPARALINKAFEDKVEFERMNAAVKKYNSALANIKKGNEDFAIVTLRRIHSQSPHMMRANELLALLYLNAGQFAKAYRVLKAALRIDRGSIVCLRYMDEAKTQLSSRRHAFSQKEDSDSDDSSAAAPQTTSTDSNTTRVAMMGIVGGVAICVLAYFALIRPVQLTTINRSWNEKLIADNEVVSDRLIEAENLMADKALLQTELDAAKESLEYYNGDEGVVKRYEQLLGALDDYFEQNWSSLIEDMDGLSGEQVDSELYASVINSLNTFISSGDIADLLYESGMQKFKKAQYKAAIGDLELCLKLSQDHVAALFQMGLAYEALGDDAAAKPYFSRIVNEFPDSTFAESAKIRV